MNLAQLSMMSKENLPKRNLTESGNLFYIHCKYTNMEIKQNILIYTVYIYANVVQANFLDVTFNLQCDKYWPYRKPNDHPLYIHSRSNHPPSIKKQLPSMLTERLSQLSCNQHMFNKATVVYQEAMQKSGYHNELKYQHSSSPTIPAKTKKENGKFYSSTPFQ